MSRNYPPSRTVTGVEVTYPTPLTIGPTLLTLDCGHVSHGTNHFVFKVGDLHSCVKCWEESPDYPWRREKEL